MKRSYITLDTMTNPTRTACPANATFDLCRTLGGCGWSPECGNETGPSESMSDYNARWERVEALAFDCCS